MDDVFLMFLLLIDTFDTLFFDALFSNSEYKFNQFLHPWFYHDIAQLDDPIYYLVVCLVKYLQKKKKTLAFR